MRETLAVYKLGENKKINDNGKSNHFSSGSKNTSHVAGLIEVDSILMIAAARG